MAEKKTYRALQVVKYGELPEVKELEIPTPGQNQVLVRIHFAPINPSDILSTQGHYPTGKVAPFTPGLEGSGIIAEVGSDLIIPYKVGDRVSVVGGGTWGEYALFDSTSVVSILPENTLEEAASHFVNPGTVICMIEEEVLKGNHKAVIHTAGSSALGRMLIRYLKEVGVKSINIVRRDDYIQELLDIGADYVLNSTSPDFEKDLKKIANEEKATLCFEAVGNPLLPKVFAAMPPKSHVLSYGVLNSPVIDGLNVVDLLFHQKQLRGFWLSACMEKFEPKQIGELFLKAQQKLKTTLRSDISKIFKYEEIKEAFEYYQKFSSKGKILLSP